MRLSIEFLGLSRLLTGQKELSLEVEDGTTFRDVVLQLSVTYPALIGDVIQLDGETLQYPNALLNRGAKQMIHADRMDERANDGDRLILMSISAGG